MWISRYLIFFAVVMLTCLSGLGQLRLVGGKSTVKFRIRNLGIAVNGSFSGLSGNITFDKNNPGAASFEARVDASSVNTGIGARDRHLKKPDYLDIEKFPAISFVSEKVTRASDGRYMVTGKLFIKDKDQTDKFSIYRKRWSKEEQGLRGHSVLTGGNSMLADQAFHLVTI